MGRPGGSFLRYNLLQATWAQLPRPSGGISNDRPNLSYLRRGQKTEVIQPDRYAGSRPSYRSVESCDRPRPNSHGLQRNPGETPCYQVAARFLRSSNKVVRRIACQDGLCASEPDKGGLGENRSRLALRLPLRRGQRLYRVGLSALAQPRLTKGGQPYL